jgi:hypothetical protein
MRRVVLLLLEIIRVRILEKKFSVRSIVNQDIGGESGDGCADFLQKIGAILTQHLYQS